MACEDIVLCAGDDECYLSCAGTDVCPDGWQCFLDLICVQPVPGTLGPGFGACVPSDNCLPSESCYEAEANGGAVNVNVCTVPGCALVDKCPTSPMSGTAEPACGDIGGGDTCCLDCASGHSCPTAMICADNLSCAFD